MALSVLFIIALVDEAVVRAVSTKKCDGEVGIAHVLRLQNNRQGTVSSQQVLCELFLMEGLLILKETRNTCADEIYQLCSVFLI